PYTGRLLSQSKVLILKIPRQKLECRIGPVANFLVQPAGASGGIDSLASSFLELLPLYATRLSPCSRELVGAQFLDLIALSLADRRDKVRLSATKTQLQLKLRAAISARLSEPHVRVKEIADAVGISVRYANMLMACQGRTIASELQATRLERSKQALEDPSQ